MKLGPADEFVCVRCGMKSMDRSCVVQVGVQVQRAKVTCTPNQRFRGNVFSALCNYLLSRLDGPDPPSRVSGLWVMAVGLGLVELVGIGVSGLIGLGIRGLGFRVFQDIFNPN